MNNQYDRRVQILAIDAATFLGFFKEGLRMKAGYQVIKGVPEDAIVLGTSIDYDTGAPILVVWSSKFPQVAKDKKFPFVQVELKPLGEQGSASSAKAAATSASDGGTARAEESERQDSPQAPS